MIKMSTFSQMAKISRVSVAKLTHVNFTCFESNDQKKFTMNFFP